MLNFTSASFRAHNDPRFGAKPPAGTAQASPGHVGQESSASPTPGLSAIQRSLKDHIDAVAANAEEVTRLTQEREKLRLSTRSGIDDALKRAKSSLKPLNASLKRVSKVVEALGQKKNALEAQLDRLTQQLGSQTRKSTEAPGSIAQPELNAQQRQQRIKQREQTCRELDKQAHAQDCVDEFRRALDELVRTNSMTMDSNPSLTQAAKSYVTSLLMPGSERPTPQRRGRHPRPQQPDPLQQALQAFGERSNLEHSGALPALRDVFTRLHRHDAASAPANWLAEAVLRVLGLSQHGMAGLLSVDNNFFARWFRMDFPNSNMRVLQSSLKKKILLAPNRETEQALRQLLRHVQSNRRELVSALRTLLYTIAEGAQPGDLDAMAGKVAQPLKQHLKDEIRHMKADASERAIPQMPTASPSTQSHPDVRMQQVRGAIGEVGQALAECGEQLRNAEAERDRRVAEAEQLKSEITRLEDLRQQERADRSDQREQYKVLGDSLKKASKAHKVSWQRALGERGALRGLITDNALALLKQRHLGRSWDDLHERVSQPGTSHAATFTTPTAALLALQEVAMAMAGGRLREGRHYLPLQHEIGWGLDSKLNKHTTRTVEFTLGPDGRIEHMFPCILPPETVAARSSQGHRLDGFA